MSPDELAYDSQANPIVIEYPRVVQMKIYIKKYDVSNFILPMAGLGFAAS